MLTIINALIPVMSIILLGVLLKRIQLFKEEAWSGFGDLCYFVLFPILLVKTLATVEVNSEFLLEYASMVLFAIFAMSALLWLMRPLLLARYRLRGASYSSLFQGATRWHGFIALSIVGILFRDEGVAFMAIIMAVIIPPLNMINVFVLARYAHGDTNFKVVLGKIFTNPFIIACYLGAGLNLANITIPGPVLEAMDIAGRGALGLSLLTVGAGIRLTAVRDNYELVAFGTLLRLLGMPGLMFLGGWLFGITGTPLVVAVIAGAVPTAATAYILARQMGGDEVLMANLITLQVIVSAVTLPFMIWLAYTP